jgi:hypothetical protein
MVLVKDFWVDGTRISEEGEQHWQSLDACAWQVGLRVTFWRAVPWGQANSAGVGRTPSL